VRTRIVYPQMWLDEKFAQCNLETKVLFCYLITSNQLGLTPYHHITDRQILFDTGLNLNQLKTGKKELTDLKWCFFTDNWVFHNHICAYVDYTGRDRVIEAKNQELKNIPDKVIHIFNPLITRYKPVLNHKSETISNNSYIKDHNSEDIGEGYIKFLEVKKKLTRMKGGEA